MPIPMPAGAVLDRYFLEMRSKVLDVAAALDRIERAADAGRAAADERMAKLRTAVEILLDAQPDRAVRVLSIFSDPYDPKWPRPAKRGASELAPSAKRGVEGLGRSNPSLRAPG